MVIDGKDDDLKMLLAGGGDVREIKKMYYEFDKTLEELEEKGGAQDVNLAMMKKLQRNIDLEMTKRKEDKLKETESCSPLRKKTIREPRK